MRRKIGAWGLAALTVAGTGCAQSQPPEAIAEAAVIAAAGGTLDPAARLVDLAAGVRGPGDLTTDQVAAALGLPASKSSTDGAQGWKGSGQGGVPFAVRLTADGGSQGPILRWVSNLTPYETAECLLVFDEVDAALVGAGYKRRAPVGAPLRSDARFFDRGQVSIMAVVYQRHDGGPACINQLELKTSAEGG